MRRFIIRRIGSGFIIVLFFLTCIGGQTFAAEGYESYFMYIKTDPHDESPGFLDGHEQFSGLAHNANNWFISAGEGMKWDHPSGEWYWGIWKIPLTSMGDNGLVNAIPSHSMTLHNLDSLISSDNETLRTMGYYHIGDIDHYQGFILVPVENSKCCSDRVTEGEQKRGVAILFFKAEDLSFVSRGRIGLLSIDWPDFGWLAVNPANGLIYVSHDHTKNLEVFEVDWNELEIQRQQPNNLDHEVSLTYKQTIPLKDENGEYFEYVFHNIQGGAFSESGNLFYWVIGICDASYGSDGIQVFDTTTWQRVKWSTLCPEDGTCSGCPDFRFYWWLGIWYLGEQTCGYGSEPEGIDVWDLDNDPRSQYPGQLHVGRLYNIAGQDNVTIFHYTNAIYTDSSWTGYENGSKGSPYNTLNEASSCAWDGSIVKMKPGYYINPISINKRVRIEANGSGTVVIGAAGP
jgi:hypothetical protein